MKGPCVTTSIWDATYNCEELEEFVIVGQVNNIKPGMWVGSDKSSLCCKYGSTCPTIDSCPFAHPYDPERALQYSSSGSKSGYNSDSGSNSPTMHATVDEIMDIPHSTFRLMAHTSSHTQHFYANPMNNNQCYVYPNTHSYLGPNNSRKTHIKRVQQHHTQKFRSPQKMHYKHVTEA